MELDLVVVGIAALFWCVTVGSIWVAARRTSKRISSIEANAFKKVDEIASRYEDKLGSMFTEARPFLQKIEGAVALLTGGLLGGEPDHEDDDEQRKHVGEHLGVQIPRG